MSESIAPFWVSSLVVTLEGSIAMSHSSSGCAMLEDDEMCRYDFSQVFEFAARRMEMRFCVGRFVFRWRGFITFPFVQAAFFRAT